MNHILPLRWGVCELGAWLLVSSATGCHKDAGLKEQPRSAVSDAADVGESVPPPNPGPNYAAMMAEDAGRCVKQVIVGAQAIAFEFNRDYYWYLGEAGTRGLISQREPFYHLVPKHYVGLYLGWTLSCGSNTDGSIECWGVDSDGAANPKPPFGLGLPREPEEAPAPRVPFDSETPLVLTDLPGPIQQFAMNEQDYCALAAGKVVCPAPRGHGSDEVRGLGVVNELLGDAGFGCARNETQVWCWGQNFIPTPGATIASGGAAAAVSLPTGIRMRSLHV